MYQELAILALFAFLYGLVSGRLSRLPLSSPLIFVLVGLGLGPLGLGWFEDDIERGVFRGLIDLTLALILFNDASTSKFAVLRRQWRLPARMLILGLPGIMLLGTLVAAWLFDALTLYEAAILGVILAATDAALGKAVITNPLAPARLRETLNCESGLNDGLCVPVLLLLIALAGGHDSQAPVALVMKELGIGAAVGIVTAGAGAWLVRHCSQRGWIDEAWSQTTIPVLAFACFAIAHSLHGSGYIAAFVGGLVFGAHLKHQLHELVVPAEGIGETMAMLTWLLFGVGVVGQGLEHITWEIVLYAVLSLTVVRMSVIYASLAGSGERPDSKLFLGWFGPRGLASVVFAIMVLEENLPGSELISTAVTATVVLSLVAHGVTANPLAAWMGRRDNRHGGEPAE